MYHHMPAMRSACGPAGLNTDSFIRHSMQHRVRCLFWLELSQPLLGLTAEHVIVASTRCILRSLAAERAHICHDAAHFIVWNAAAPCRHSVWPPFHDRCEDTRWIAAVDPFVIHQRRTHATAAH